MEQEKMTVKEWAIKSGLGLCDYDGFTDIYINTAKMQGGNNKLIDYLKIRFRDGGDLYCTRKGFLAGVANGCTIELPHYDQLKEMVQTIPEFVESNSDIYINFIMSDLKKSSKLERRKLIYELSNRVLLKQEARERSIKLNGDDTFYIDEIEPDDIIKSFLKDQVGTTIEDLENKLFRSINAYLKILKSKKEIYLSDIPFEEVELLTRLSSYSYRNKSKKDDYEYILINIPGVKKDDLVVPFKTVDDDVHYAAVDFDKFSGVIPSTKEINDKIEDRIEGKFYK